MALGQEARDGMAIEARQPNGERYDFVALALATGDELERVMRMGSAPDLKGLSGFEFRGYNTLDITELFGFRKFKKGFYRADTGRDPAMGIQGYNVVVEQNSLGNPWRDVLRGAAPIRHGYYEVSRVDLCEVDNRYPNAVLLDYGKGKNAPYNPVRLLRDYVVQVYSDNPDLLLGKAYVALGPLRIFVSYFVLGREGRSGLPA